MRFERLRTSISPLPPHDDLPFGIDQHAASASYWTPNLFQIVMVGVVDHRVLDLVPQDRFADVLGVLLALELGRVDADHHQLVRDTPAPASSAPAGCACS